MKTYERVYNLVRKIPKGKVCTYGQIGQMLELDPRVIGWALNKLVVRRPYTVSREEQKRKKSSEPREPRPEIRDPTCEKGHRSSQLAGHRSVPWQRVINSKGKISTNKVLNIPLGLQQRLLEKEGIRFDQDAKVNLKKYSYNFCKHKIKH